MDNDDPLRTEIASIATVVIDEVQMLEDKDRGDRFDGMIARLKYLAPQAPVPLPLGNDRVAEDPREETELHPGSVRGTPGAGCGRYLLFYSSASGRSRPSSR